MAKQLLFTSAPKGVWPGTSGYCTVMCSESLPRAVAEHMEKLSVFRILDSENGSPIPLVEQNYSKLKSINPNNLAHLTFRFRGKETNVILRTSLAGFDYSGRLRKLSHMFLIDESEKVSTDPASLLFNQQLFRNDWEEEPRTESSDVTLPPGSLNDSQGQTWGQLKGDPGWAQFVATHILRNPRDPIYIIFDRGVNLIQLIAEVAELIPPARRWQLTYATNFVPFGVDVRCQLRFVPRTSPDKDTIIGRNDVTVDLSVKEKSPVELVPDVVELDSDSPHLMGDATPPIPGRLPQSSQTNKSSVPASTGPAFENRTVRPEPTAPVPQAPPNYTHAESEAEKIFLSPKMLITLSSLGGITLLLCVLVVMFWINNTDNKGVAAGGGQDNNETKQPKKTDNGNGGPSRPERLNKRDSLAALNKLKAELEKNRQNLQKLAIDKDGVILCSTRIDGSLFVNPIIVDAANRFTVEPVEKSDTEFNVLIEGSPQPVLILDISNGFEVKKVPGDSEFNKLLGTVLHLTIKDKHGQEISVSPQFFPTVTSNWKFHPNDKPINVNEIGIDELSSLVQIDLEPQTAETIERFLQNSLPAVDSNRAYFSLPPVHLTFSNNPDIPVEFSNKFKRVYRNQLRGFPRLRVDRQPGLKAMTVESQTLGLRFHHEFFDFQSFGGGNIEKFINNSATQRPFKWNPLLEQLQFFNQQSKIGLRLFEQWKYGAFDEPKNSLTYNITHSDFQGHEFKIDLINFKNCPVEKTPPNVTQTPPPNRQFGPQKSKNALDAVEKEIRPSLSELKRLAIDRNEVVLCNTSLHESFSVSPTIINAANTFTVEQQGKTFLVLTEGSPQPLLILDCSEGIKVQKKADNSTFDKILGAVLHFTIKDKHGQSFSVSQQFFPTTTSTWKIHPDDKPINAYKIGSSDPPLPVEISIDPDGAKLFNRFIDHIQPAVAPNKAYYAFQPVHLTFPSDPNLSRVYRNRLLGYPRLRIDRKMGAQAMTLSNDVLGIQFQHEFFDFSTLNGQDVTKFIRNSNSPRTFTWNELEEQLQTINRISNMRLADRKKWKYGVFQKPENTLSYRFRHSDFEKQEFVIDLLQFQDCPVEKEEPKGNGAGGRQFDQNSPMPNQFDQGNN